MEKIKFSVSWLLRISVAILFIYAGILKFLDPVEFYRDILNYQIMPDICAYAIAYFLPPFEILLGFAMLLSSFLKSALFGISLLLAVFIIALVSTIARGLDISCGCFGSWNPATALESIVKDTAVLFACLVIYLLNSNKNLLKLKPNYE
jgi:uncharacterized membrane protein YphA (DoxX/SURF4 family)